MGDVTMTDAGQVLEGDVDDVLVGRADVVDGRMGDPTRQDDHRQALCDFDDACDGQLGRDLTADPHVVVHLRRPMAVDIPATARVW